MLDISLFPVLMNSTTRRMRVRMRESDLFLKVRLLAKVSLHLPLSGAVKSSSKKLSQEYMRLCLFF